MATIDLLGFDGETVIGTIDKLDDFMAAGMPTIVVWGTRAFARNTDGQYIQINSVDQAVTLPANIPRPPVGATDGYRRDE